MWQEEGARKYLVWIGIRGSTGTNGRRTLSPRSVAQRSYTTAVYDLPLNRTILGSISATVWIVGIPGSRGHGLEQPKINLGIKFYGPFAETLLLLHCDCTGYLHSALVGHTMKGYQ